MLVSVAVCPHPPVIVPALAGEAAPELDGLRAACDEAVRRLRAPGVDALIVVGGGLVTHAYGPDAHPTLQPYAPSWTMPVTDGGDADGAGDDGRRGESLPLSLTIGHWLLRRQEAEAGARYHCVAFDASPGECLRLGRELAESAARVGLLVMGDGTACRSEKAPGYLDARAGPYDAAVARALGQGDTAALAALDPGLSRELQVAGRAAWQVLAGAAGTGGLAADLLADEAPYGVGYFVASWRAAPGG